MSKPCGTTHIACQEQLEKHGGKTQCCRCTGHECSLTDTNNEELSELIKTILFAIDEHAALNHKMNNDARRMSVLHHLNDIMEYISDHDQQVALVARIYELEKENTVEIEMFRNGKFPDTSGYRDGRLIVLEAQEKL